MILSAAQCGRVGEKDRTKEERGRGLNKARS